MNNPHIYLCVYNSMKRWRVARQPRKWSSLSYKERAKINEAYAFILNLNKERERKEYEQREAYRAEKLQHANRDAEV